MVKIKCNTFRMRHALRIAVGITVLVLVMAGGASANEFEVLNQPPVADFAFSPVTPTVIESVTFNASYSSDPDGYITDYSWDFGDGDAGVGIVVTHSYPLEGIYVVKLTVTDNSGTKDTVSKSIVIISDTYKNIALNPSRTGYPHPTESDNGWGGGTDKWDIVDGIVSYPNWAEGLAFCGGLGNYCGQPPGWYQATINFGENKTFNAVRVWHHGTEHVPTTYKIQYWNGSGWVDVYSTNSNTRCKDISNPSDCIGTAWSGGITDKFSAVTSKKVRFTLNNYDITHGWIWEFEVFGGNIPPSVSISTDKSVYTPGETVLLNLSISNPMKNTYPSKIVLDIIWPTAEEMNIFTKTFSMPPEFSVEKVSPYPIPNSIFVPNGDYKFNATLKYGTNSTGSKAVITIKRP